MVSAKNQGWIIGQFPALWQFCEFIVLMLIFLPMCRGHPSQCSVGPDPVMAMVQLQKSTMQKFGVWCSGWRSCHENHLFSRQGNMGSAEGCETLLGGEPLDKTP